jgi:hypothetical protein
MNNLGVVFRSIKEHCKEAGTSNEKCFSTLEKLEINRQLFLSLYLYIEVLQSLGLIKFNNYTRAITLTEKGKHTEIPSIYGWYTSLLIILYFLRRAFLFILFWPVFFIQKPMASGEEKESAG